MHVQGSNGFPVLGNIASLIDWGFEAEFSNIFEKFKFSSLNYLYLCLRVFFFLEGATFVNWVTEIHYLLSPTPRRTLIKGSFILKTYNFYLIRWSRAYRWANISRGISQAFYKGHCVLQCHSEKGTLNHDFSRAVGKKEKQLPCIVNRIIQAPSALSKKSKGSF